MKKKGVSELEFSNSPHGEGVKSVCRYYLSVFLKERFIVFINIYFVKTNRKKSTNIANNRKTTQNNTPTYSKILLNVDEHSDGNRFLIDCFFVF